MDYENLTGGAFVALGLALLVAERAAHGRRALQLPWNRWLTNLGLFVAGGIASALVFSGSLTGVAAELDGGLVGGLGLPLAVEAILVFLFLDCWRYWEHRLFHEVPLLWRLHLVHHSDTGVDVTTAQRHHPLEGMLTSVLMLILLFSLGFSPLALGLYLLVATLSSLYTHTSLTVPEAIDRRLRYWLVTPSVHGIHHSAVQAQTNSNYGSVLSIWDRLFGSYCDPGRETVERVGLEQFRRPVDGTLAAALLQPFEYRPGHAPGEPAESGAAARAGGSAAPASRSAAWLAAGGALLVLVGMWSAVQDLAAIWGSSDSYQYAWLVPCVFLYLLCWPYREELLAAHPRPSLGGLGVVALALLLWLGAGIVDIRLGQHLALVLALQGVAVCALGWRLYGRYLPLMLLLFLAVPSGDLFLVPLRELTVLWIDGFAALLDLPFEREGYTVHVGAHRYVVIDACAGLATFALGGFLGYSFGLMLYRSLARVVALAALGAALGILSNAVRVCAIVALDYRRGSQMGLDAHGDVQLAVLFGLLALMLFAVHRLPASPLPAIPATAPAGPRGRLAPLAPLMAGVLVVVTLGVTTLGLATSASRSVVAATADGDAELALLAADNPGSRWLAGDGQDNARILSLPGDDGGEVRIFATSAGNARPPEQRLLRPPGTGWRHSGADELRHCSGADCVAFRTILWTRAGSRDRHSTAYTYFVGDTATSSRLAFRLLSGWRRLSGKPVTTGMVSFHSEGRGPGERDLAAQFLQLRAAQRPQLAAGPG
ncbi:archaeosortase/exosortase family protein [Pseudohaliea sp.]|uniref:archaeosortase/exosortase family protein n=1 Tax=Pseudohaliea sp. TaxID=2740289 RepID=UPI0032ED8FE7